MSLRQFQETAQIGLEAALTAAVAHAQIAGAEEICERLLMIKRDVVRSRLRREDDRAVFSASIAATFEPAIVSLTEGPRA